MRRNSSLTQRNSQNGCRAGWGEGAGRGLAAQHSERKCRRMWVAARQPQPGDSASAGRGLGVGWGRGTANLGVGSTRTRPDTKQKKTKDEGQDFPQVFRHVWRAPLHPILVGHAVECYTKRISPARAAKEGRMEGPDADPCRGELAFYHGCCSCITRRDGASSPLMSLLYSFQPGAKNCVPCRQGEVCWYTRHLKHDTRALSRRPSIPPVRIPESRLHRPRGCGV